MSDPLVSCVVACHNYGRYLGAALESVLAQTYPTDRLDVIVIDDGSTDETPLVAARYAAQVRIFRTEHRGLLQTINRGLCESRGELIAFCSADDTWMPDKVVRQVAYLADHPKAGLVHSDMEIIDASGDRLHPSFLQAFAVPPVEGRILPLLLQRNVVSGGPAMVRSELLSTFHPIPPAIAAWEDWWMAFKVAQVAEIGLIREPLYRYRRHDSNMNLGSSGDRLLGHVRAELPFRRHMLTSLEYGEVTTAELYAGLRQLLELSAKVAAATSVPFAEVLPVTAADQAHAADRIGVAQGLDDPQQAAFELVAALAHDPWSDDAMERLRLLGAAAA